MSTRNTPKKKKKWAASSSSLHGVDNGSKGKDKDMVSIDVGIKANFIRYSINYKVIAKDCIFCH